MKNIYMTSNMQAITQPAVKDDDHLNCYQPKKDFFYVGNCLYQRNSMALKQPLSSTCFNSSCWNLPMRKEQLDIEGQIGANMQKERKKADQCPHPKMERNRKKTSEAYFSLFE